MHYKVVWRIVVIAIFVCFILKDRNKTNKDANMNSDCNEDAKETANIISHIEASESDDMLELNDVKDDVAKKMSKRHQEAEKIVKESVENIFGEVEVGGTKNETTKKKMFEDLDNI